MNDQVAGFLIALSVHALLFLAGAKVLIQPAQYGVQAGGGVEVNLVASPPTVLPATAGERIQPPDIPGMDATTFQSRAGAVTQYNPKYFQNPAPLYPERARQLRQEGLVTLLVAVDREGRPARVEIERSSGYCILDQSALEAVRGWKFQPARLGGLAVESKVRVPIRFRLEE